MNEIDYIRVPSSSGELWLFDDGISRILMVTLEPLHTRDWVTDRGYQTWKCSLVGIPSTFHTGYRFKSELWDFPSTHLRLLVKG